MGMFHNSPYDCIYVFKNLKKLAYFIVVNILIFLVINNFIIYFTKIINKNLLRDLNQGLRSIKNRDNKFCRFLLFFTKEEWEAIWQLLP